MPRLAANLSWLFTERPFLERFDAARAVGFAATEIMFPYEVPAAEVATAAQRADLPIVLFNLPPGSAGERGMAALPGREAELAASVEQAAEYAAVLGTGRLHAMAGTVPQDVEWQRCHDCYVRNLRHAARRLADDGITLLIEPLNRRDAPGYFLETLEQAVAVLEEVGSPNLLIQADLYHLQIAGGDVLTRLTAAMPRIGHVQLAGVPDRGEPDRGELAYGRVFEAFDGLGYDGWIGCEYRPATSTEAGLGWAAPWLNRARP